MARVLILAAPLELRDLEEILHASYVVHRAETWPVAGREPDLYVVSATGLERWHEALTSRERAGPGARAPVLMAVPRETLEALPSVPASAVDDILSLPSPRPEIAFRIQRLLSPSRRASDVAEDRQPLSGLHGRLADRLARTHFLALAAFNREGVVVDANDAFIRMLGYSREALSSGALRRDQLIPSDQRDVDEAMRGELLQSESSQPREIEYLKSDGGRVALLFGYSASRNASPLTLGYALDVTARRKMEKELRTHKERSELIARATQDALWDWDLRTGEAWWNDNYYSKFETDRSIVPSLESWSARIHPEDRAAVIEHINAAVRSKVSSWSSEYRFLTASGEYARVFDRAYTQFDAKGEPIRMVGAVMDITERKRHEDERKFLVDAGSRLSASLDFNQTAETIARVGLPFLADWCMADIGPAGRPRVGLIAQSSSHQAASEVLHSVLTGDRSKREPSAGVSESPRLITTGLQEELRERFPGLSELGADVLSTAKAAIVAPLVVRGRVLGTVAWGMSSRQAGERELLLATVLAHRCAVALENALLYLQAQTAVHLRDEFISVAAHEMKTPLATLKSYAALLKEPSAKNASFFPGAVASIDRQCSRLTRLVERLVGFSMLQVGNYQLHFHPFDLTQLVSQTVARMAPSAPEHLLRVKADSPVPVDADQERIAEVLSNLIENAVKFSREASVVEVTVARRGDEALVSVHDEGIGIPAEHQPRIFERYFRSDISRDRDRYGLGLGLWICHELIARHGGRIWYESAEGKGTTFTFALPI